MALEVRRRRIGPGDRAVEILDIVGRLDTPGAALLRSSVQDALREGSSRIALNLSDCVEIHRETVGTLHSLGRACNRAGGKLVIFGAAGDVYEYIKTFTDPGLVPWHETENEAITALGGRVVPAQVDQAGEEPPAVVALGSDDVFRKVFWKLGALGGRPVAKFDSIEAAMDFMRRRPVHSVIIDAKLPQYDVIALVRQIRTTPEIRGMGIFAVGPPSMRGRGRTILEEGADNFVPLVFTGEEIVAKLDLRAFFSRLKEAYDRFDASHPPA
jgi:CheY-like chemotaxis protein/anti-anti-sigma regulatory factor